MLCCCPYTLDQQNPTYTTFPLLIYARHARGSLYRSLAVVCAFYYETFPLMITPILHQSTRTHAHTQRKESAKTFVHIITTRRITRIAGQLNRRGNIEQITYDREQQVHITYSFFLHSTAVLRRPCFDDDDQIKV